MTNIEVEVASTRVAKPRGATFRGARRPPRRAAEDICENSAAQSEKD